MKNYLKVLRPINLILLVLAQYLIKYSFFESFEVALALQPLSFIFLVTATICIAAGGNVINDIYDVKIDSINKADRVIVGKDISEKAAYKLYFFLTILGVGSGFIVANIVGKPGLSVVFIFVATLLYWYASFIKSILLIGNFLISLLVGLSLLIVVLFDVFPVLNEMDKEIQLQLSKTVFWYSLAGFYFNLTRELIKDIQDINGDKNGGRNTLPIALGVSRTTFIINAMAVFGFFSLLFFSYYSLYEHPLILAYFIFILAGLLLVFIINCYNASSKKDVVFLSTLLKLFMFFGVISISFIHIIF